MFKNMKNHLNKIDDVSVIKLWNIINMKGKGPLNYSSLKVSQGKKKAILEDHFITCQWKNG